MALDPNIILKLKTPELDLDFNRSVLEAIQVEQAITQAPLIQAALERENQQQIQTQQINQSTQKGQFLNLFSKELKTQPQERRESSIQQNAQILQTLGINIERLSGATDDQLDNIINATNIFSEQEEATGGGFDFIGSPSRTQNEAGENFLTGLATLPDGTIDIVSRPIDGSFVDIIGETGAQRTERALEQKLGTKQTEQSIALAGKAFEQIPSIHGSIQNIDTAIQAIDDGAETGVINSMLPSVRDASIRLDQLRNELGLDVIGSVTFGALSKGELDLALATALPTKLGPAALREWLVSKKDAQEKVLANLEEAAVFFNRGGTLADFLESKGVSGQTDPNQIDPTDLGSFSTEQLEQMKQQLIQQAE